MSELLDAAAQVVGAPAELVQRSAEARADADGIAVEEVLKAWAGGGPTPSSPPGVETPPPAVVPAPAETAPAAPVSSGPPTPAVPAVAPPPVAQPVVAAVAPPGRPAAVASGPPPVLKGRVDRPFRYFFGAASLLMLCLVVSLVLPAFSASSRGALHSEIPYSATALVGQGEYLAEGCAGCHTQIVRPIIADAQLAASAGLGGITLSDTNQVIGRQRYGPDLANVGNRLSPEAIQVVLGGEGGHVQYRGGWMDALVAYLAESKTLTEAAGE